MIKIKSLIIGVLTLLYVIETYSLIPRSFIQTELLSHLLFISIINVVLITRRNFLYLVLTVFIQSIGYLIFFEFFEAFSYYYLACLTIGHVSYSIIQFFNLRYKFVYLGVLLTASISLIYLMTNESNGLFLLAILCYSYISFIPLSLITIKKDASSFKYLLVLLTFYSLASIIFIEFVYATGALIICLLYTYKRNISDISTLNTDHNK
jgi:hypothetical protein